MTTKRKYPRLGNNSIAIEYLNNHCPQKVVREVLKERGVPDDLIALIDWNKARFPGAEFAKRYTKPLSKWPSAKRRENNEV